MVKIEELEKELNQGILKNIYILYGEELFLLENVLKKIRNVFGECIKGINYIPIDDTNIGGIISDIETPAFGYEKKLIIAKNTGLFKKEKKTAKGPELENIKLANKVAEYIEENEENHVLYRVTPIFKRDNCLASGVEIEAYSVEDKGQGICFNVYVYNVQPGITIDYKTGKSIQN